MQQKNSFHDKDCIPVPALRAMQLEKLQKIIAYEYDRVALFRNRCDEKGIKPRDLKTLADLAKFPFMKKTDLRDEYPLGLTAAPMSEINRFHCSSGTTGKPICIPQTAGDVEIWTESVARCLSMYGITRDDVVQVSYGYGLFTGGLGAHYGAEKLGCAVLPTGAGNTEKQIMLMKDLNVTVICCTPSYFLHLATVAEKLGVDFRRDTKLKHGIFGAEPWTDEMRSKIENISGITAHDIYGLTEIAGPGVAGNCGHSNGLHIWEDHFYPEIVDPDTLEPLPDGEEGELVITTLDRFGTPMIRYRTRDLSRLQVQQCPCGRTMRVMDRVHARSDDMLIIHGVNVFPSQIEACLLKVPQVAPHYMIELSSTATMDRFEIKVEVTEGAFSDTVSDMELIRRKVASSIKEVVGLSPIITLVPSGTLPRSEGKIKRVIDNRGK
jgi:phenylacetate-CoA ligase